MASRVGGIVSNMKHWLEQTTGDPLQEYRLDRDAVRQLVEALQAEPKAPLWPDGWPFVDEGAQPPVVHEAGEITEGAWKALKPAPEPAVPPFAWIACVCDGDGGGKVELGYCTIEDAQAAHKHIVDSALNRPAERT